MASSVTGVEWPVKPCVCRLFIPIAALVASRPADNETNYVGKHEDGFRLKDKEGGSLIAFAFIAPLFILAICKVGPVSSSLQIISSQNSTPVSNWCVLHVWEPIFCVITMWTVNVEDMYFACVPAGVCARGPDSGSSRCLIDCLISGTEQLQEHGGGTAVHTVSGSLGSG